MWPFSEMSLGTATFIGTVANWALLGSLLAGVLSTFVIVKTTDVKEHHWDQLRQASSEEIAKANVRAAEATHRAMKTQLELEKLRAPREIKDENFASIIAKLAPFSDQEWVVTTYWDLKEPLALSNRIKQVLDLCGWKYTPHKEGHFILGITTGIEVYVHPNAQERTKQAASAFVEVLKGADLDAVLKQQNAPNDPSNKIALNVGIKP